MNEIAQHTPDPAGVASTPFVPTGRAAGLGPFPAVKQFECGCVLTTRAADSVAQTVDFRIDFRECKARHVPVPTHAQPRAPCPGPDTEEG